MSAPFMLKTLFYFHPVQMPDVIHILLDRSVRCKLAGSRHIQHCHPGPFFLVSVCSFHLLLCLCIALEVRQG